MAINYFKFSTRLLLRNKLHSIINVSGLSLGLACTMLILLYVKDELSYDRFHHDVDRIYRIVIDVKTPDAATTGAMGSSSTPAGPRFAESIPEIESFVRIKDDRREIVVNGEVNEESVTLADPNVFSMFNFPLLYGDPLTSLNTPRSVVISEKFALVLFHTSDAIGKTIMIRNGQKFESYSVSGVARNCPENSSIKFEIVMPLPAEIASEQKWLNSALTTFLKLAAGADAIAVERKIQGVFDKAAKEELAGVKSAVGYDVEFHHNLQAMTSIHLNNLYSVYDGLAGGSKPIYSYILGGIALFILLIACFNFINLSIAQSAKRAKEIGVRKVIGGSRAQLIRQFLSESMLLSGLSFLLALGLTFTLLPFFNSLVGKSLSFSYLADATLIIAYLAIFLFTALFAGSYPAFILSGYNPVKTLYLKFKLSGNSNFQKGLVVIQFSLAMMLATGAFIASQQFDFLTTKDLGYDKNNLLFLYKKDLSRKEVKLLAEQLSSEAGIEGVTAMEGAGLNAKTVDGKNIYFSYMTVDENFLEVNKIPLVAGRNFSPAFPGDSVDAVLINETFAKEAGFKDPIGQELVSPNPEHPKSKVIGVVRDYHFNELTYAISPQLFVLNTGRLVNRVEIRIRPGFEVPALAKIEATFKSMFPMTSYRYIFLEDRLKALYANEDKWRQVMRFGATLTIVISCIGIFGLSLLSAERRLKEVGIRKVLGASVKSIVMLLTREYVGLVLLGIIIAVPVSYALSERWLQSYPYRIIPGYSMFVFSGISVIVIALLTVGYQSLKAALTNPVRWLRSE